ncbi:MAG: TetR/AcrR family transcriptional regulator [Ignavibacteria bacterium]|nr:TetR/AcrR family transcriptional regulator [Ignavibacteria bacterium]
MGIAERKEREKEARRGEILEAAEKVFFEKGLNQATMDEIAAEAELGKSTLYLYYRSKEDLYLAVMMRGSEVMFRLFMEATSTGEPTLKLIRNLGDAYYEFFKKHRNYFRMYYFFESPDLHTQVSDEMKAACFRNDEKIWGLVIGLIRKAIAEKVFRDDIDPQQTAVILWANANGLMRQMDRMEPYWRDAMKIDLDATLRRANTFVLQGMMTDKAKKQFAGLFE